MRRVAYRRSLLLKRSPLAWLAHATPPPSPFLVQAGAQIVPKLDPLACDVIAGVKEPVASTLPLAAGSASQRRPAAHLAFFHCHKGQAYNFPLVRTLLESSKQCGTRFIDYELLTDAPTRDASGAETAGGKRTVGFGFLAGYSGMADGLAQLGTKLLAAKGAATPFLSLERPIQAGTVDRMRRELERVGDAIRLGGLDSLDSPVRLPSTCSCRTDVCALRSLIFCALG